MSFLIWATLGLMTGWLAGRWMQGYGYGPLMDRVLGLAGGMLGGVIADASRWGAPYHYTVSGIGAILGAITATGLIGYASGERRFSSN